jgi:hypothetical protein
VVFLSPSRQLGKYLKLGHDHFLPHPFQFINHNTIGATQSEQLTVMLNKPYINKISKWNFFCPFPTVTCGFSAREFTHYYGNPLKLRIVMVNLHDLLPQLTTNNASEQCSTTLFAHSTPNLTTTHEGKPQNFALWKGVQNNTWTQKKQILYVNPKLH